MGARGPGAWGGVQAGSLCGVRLWEMRAFPPDRGPPGLSSRGDPGLSSGGDFVSFPAPPEGDTPPLSSSAGSPRRPQDLLFTAGFLLRTPACFRGLGLCSELLSLLRCCSYYDIGLG